MSPGSSYACLHYHIIFSTKDRRPLIRPDLRERLHAYIGGILRDQKGKLLAAGGMPDHMHILASLHPTTAVADAARLIKSNSSKWIHETFAELRTFHWQDGYGAFTVSLSGVAEVTRYIAGQEEHHRRLTVQEEFIAFLDKHEIEYDPRYIWA